MNFHRTVNAKFFREYIQYTLFLQFCECNTVCIAKSLVGLRLFSTPDPPLYVLAFLCYSKVLLPLYLQRKSVAQSFRPFSCKIFTVFVLLLALPQ